MTTVDSTGPGANPGPARAPERTRRPTDAHGLSRRLGRRRLLQGAVGLGVSALALESRVRLARPAAPRADVGTPDASPVASPAAMPNVTGRLQVVRDQRPSYDAKPVESDRLSLFLSQGSNDDFSPTAFRQDFLIPASYLDPLVWVDEVTMEPKPWLAKSWEWSADGKTITYTLRDDVKWHDGDALTAKDVRFSLFVYRDDVDSNVRNLFSLMDNAEELGPHRLKVTLTQPDGEWLLNASTQLIVQRKQYTAYWSARPEGERTLTGFDWSKSPPIGTGPWKIGKREKGTIELTRNDAYWAGPPHFKTMTLSWEPDAAKRLRAWKDGKVDLLWPVRPDDLPTVNDVEGRLYVADAASVMFAAFNFANPGAQAPDVFKDVRVRNALSLAIDRSRYAAEVFHGFIHQDAAGTIAQPWAHDDSIVNPPRDLKAARDLLTQVGWQDRNGDGVIENADGKPMALTAIVGNDARPELLKVLQRVADDLKEVGVRLDVQALDPDKFRDRWINTHDFDLIAYAYNLFPGFTDFDLYGSAWDIRTNPQGGNPGGYKNVEVDNAIQEILGTEDLTKQRASLSRLQQAANKDLFALWLGFPQDLILVRPDILGFQPSKLWQTMDTRLLWRQPAS